MSPGHQKLCLLLAEAFLICLKLLGKLCIQTRRTPFLRSHDYNRTMGIFKEISPDQLLKVTGSHLCLHSFKGFQRLHMHEWLGLVIQPAVHHLKPIHKAFWIISEVRLAVTEFMIVNPSLKSLSVYAVFCKAGKHLLNQFHKLFLLTFLRIFCNHRENRLIDSIVIGTHNVLSDSGICQRLLKRRARRRKKRIIQNLEGKVKLPVKAGPNHLIVGKIRILLLWFITCNGIGKGMFLHFLKRLLEPDSGIYFFCIKKA